MKHGELHPDRPLHRPAAILIPSLFRLLDHPVPNPVFGASCPFPRSEDDPSPKWVVAPLLQGRTAFPAVGVGSSLYGRNGYREQCGIRQSSRPSTWQHVQSAHFAKIAWRWVRRSPLGCFTRCVFPAELMPLFWTIANRSLFTGFPPWPGSPPGPGVRGTD
jgi:hypothetical protein